MALLHKECIVGLALGLCILAIYANSFSTPFCYDDAGWLREENVKDGPSEIIHFFDGSSNRCASRGLAMASFNLNYSLTGEDTWSYHAVNIALHASCSFLVFLLSRHILLNCIETPSPGILAFCVAILFATSPVQAYAVTYICQRMEIMATLGILLSLWLWIKGKRALALIPFILGCLSKEIAFITPFFIMLYVGMFERFEYKKIGIALVVAAGLYLGIAQVSQPLHDVILGNDVKTAVPVWKKCNMQTPFVATDVIIEYTKRLLWPTPANLSIDMEYYPTNRTEGMEFPPVVNELFFKLFGGMILLGVGALAYGQRWFILGLGLYLMSFIVYSVLIDELPDKIVAHRMYLAAFPMYFLVVGTLNRFLGCKPTVLVTLVLATIFGFWTIQVNKTFASEEIIWLDAREKGPTKIRAAYNYAHTVEEAGHIGMGAYPKHTKHTSALPYLLGIVRKNQDLLAEKEYYEVLRRVDNLTFVPSLQEEESIIRTYNQLGVIFCFSGRITQAIQCWRKYMWIPACRINMEWTELWLAKGARPDIINCIICTKEGLKSRVLVTDAIIEKDIVDVKYLCSQGHRFGMRAALRWQPWTLFPAKNAN